MAINCGSCQGSHPTVKEVRDCFSGRPLPVRSVPSEAFIGRAMATDKQKNFILALIKGKVTEPCPNDGQDVAPVAKGFVGPCVLFKGHPIHHVDSLDLITKSDASKIIGHLLTLPKVETSKGGSLLLGKAPDKGTFAVLLDGKASNQVTLRFHKPSVGRYAGKRVVQYLFGPDNTSMYRTFGIVSEDGVTVFPAYTGDSRSVQALKFMLSSDRDAMIKMGETYALQSNNCWRCGRDLTKEKSITRGMGPVCAQKELLLA